MNKVGCPKGHKQTPEHIAKRVALISGKKRSPESIERYKISNKHINLGRVKPIEEKIRISLSERGNKNHNWQGGKEKENLIERGRLEYRLWRKRVFERDNYTCQSCGIKGVTLNAHHIKPFSEYENLRFDINNGITYCEHCHSKNDKYYYNFKFKELVC